MNTTVFFSATTGGFYPGAPYGKVGDEVEISAEQHATLIAGQASGRLIVLDERGFPVLGDPPPLSLAQQEQLRIVAVQQVLDTAARNQRYASLADAISYADESSVPRYQAEGLAFRAWRSRVWAHCHDVFDRVNAGTITMPSVATLISSLPALQLPQA
ncbi:hypothetical protein CEG14_15515 [Bordetella genomosp. 1]|uniref:Phage tail protein n=1 Tax=Bordetella genomosp. 1 TaxID=1395607 RepID=A0A261SGW5_9BORD|nr:hypothetical protein [Bordetella genomosp. 1]OZI36405.1 hypothetical protein CEG14_15515 [Bordetella genomosp. 1]